MTSTDDVDVLPCDMERAYEFAKTGWMKGSDGIRILGEIFARHRIATRPTDTGLVAEIEAAIGAYHDAMPQAQGESGDPFAAKEACKSMARVLYKNSDTILSALTLMGSRLTLDAL